MGYRMPGITRETKRTIAAMQGLGPLPEVPTIPPVPLAQAAPGCDEVTVRTEGGGRGIEIVFVPVMFRIDPEKLHEWLAQCLLGPARDPEDPTPSRIVTNPVRDPELVVGPIADALAHALSPASLTVRVWCDGVSALADRRQG